MKQFSPLLLISLVLIFSACKKDPPLKDDSSSIDITGKWKQTNYEHSYYINNELQYTENNLDEEDPEIMQLKADGTGNFANSTELLGTFNYTSTKTNLTFKNYITYSNGEPLPVIPPFSLTIISLNATQLKFDDEISTTDEGKTHKYITKSTYIRMK